MFCVTHLSEFLRKSNTVKTRGGMAVFVKLYGVVIIHETLIQLKALFAKNTVERRSDRKTILT